jgi:signal transduction histidine kinase
MAPAWSRFVRELSRHALYVPAGLALWVAIGLAAGAAAGEPPPPGPLLRDGLLLVCSVFGSFAAFHAVLTVLQQRTGSRWQPPLLANLLLALVGMLLGLQLVQLARHGRGWQPGTLLPALLVGGTVSLLFFLHLAWRQAREDALRSRAALAEARSLALEQQMRPHFLFNALNSLAELVESRSDQAADAVHALARLYRLILEASQRRSSPLASELEIARLYLELEQLRLGDRLAFSLPSATPGAELPSLVLQTLVENAVRHGIAPSVEGGRVEVRIAPAQDGWHRLIVENTGEPPRPGPDGVGLANTRERLTLLHGEAHGFALEREGERTRASFRFR